MFTPSIFMQATAPVQRQSPLAIWCRLRLWSLKMGDPVYKSSAVAEMGDRNSIQYCSIQMLIYHSIVDVGQKRGAVVTCCAPIHGGGEG